MAIAFVDIEGHNFRVSNIKEFGISYEEYYRDFVVDDFSERFRAIKIVAWGVLNIASSLTGGHGSEDKNRGKKKDTRPYFYITTYQGVNHKFLGEYELLESYKKMIYDALR